jgi:hypothetical protein
MNDAKYIGMDVHQATISVAVRDSRGYLVMEAIVETKAETILQFIHGLRGDLQVTFEEGTWAAWLHDLLQPHVARVLACEIKPAVQVELHLKDVKKAPGFLEGGKPGALGVREDRRNSWLLGCYFEDCAASRQSVCNSSYVKTISSPQSPDSR